MIEDNHIELLKKIPLLKKHVEDYENYLPKIQTIHSQMHRKKMVKDYMKERLLEFARRNAIELSAMDLKEEEPIIKN